MNKVIRHGFAFDPTYQWNDVSAEEALDLVLQGGSIFVRGIAGTGKSHLIRETLIPALEKQGKTVAIIAKTHNAAMVAGGDTADHWAWKHVREGGTRIDVVWCDEVSMLNAQLLRDLNHASFRDPPIQFVLSGDFNQYEPFYNNYLGTPIYKSFEDCELLHALTGNRVTLTECKRSDQLLFDWYSSIAKGGSRHKQPLSKTVAEARLTFCESKAKGFIPGTKLAPTNLVLSHRLREKINKQCNEADAPAHAERFTLAEFGIISEAQTGQSESKGATNQPQDALFWPGLRVVAHCQGRKLRNGRSYEIVELKEKTVKIRPCTISQSTQSAAVVAQPCDSSPSGASANEPRAKFLRSLRLAAEEVALAHSQIIELPRAKFFRSMRLPYAVTFASAQGLTISGLLGLHDTSHSHFGWRNLFVGLSRATGNDRVIVY
jgi:hypothetical protein